MTTTNALDITTVPWGQNCPRWRWGDCPSGEKVIPANRETGQVAPAIHEGYGGGEGRKVHQQEPVITHLAMFYVGTGVPGEWDTAPGHTGDHQNTND